MEDTLMRKLQILADSAKYDVSCSTSGVGRMGSGQIGNARISGLCHTWSADGRCVSLLKVLFTNNCIYNCAYCVNRRDNDFPRASFEPAELAALTMEFYRRNYIEGLFISSAVEISPNYTAERILQCLTILREECGFAGYIHAKIIPGVSPDLLHRIGLVADRVSVNIEFPTEESLKQLAPQKQPKQIFAPMRQITNTLIETGSLKGPGTMFQGQDLNTPAHYLSGGQTANLMSSVKQANAQTRSLQAAGPANAAQTANALSPAEAASFSRAVQKPRRRGRPPGKNSFAPAGQTTQMIIGAGGETDRNILTTSERLYHTFKMKRVFYSAYVPVVKSPILPDRHTSPPLAREHRLYQADWLLRFYGFSVSELFGKEDGNLDPDLDPKVIWALRNLDQFPVEVNAASYEMLMRIPGIGNISARRIIRQRRFAAVRFDDLKKMGVVMKRAKYFLLCCGQYYGDRRFEPETIRNSILQMENGLQLSMFDENWNPLEEGARQEKLSAAGVI